MGAEERVSLPDVAPDALRGPMPSAPAADRTPLAEAQLGEHEH